MKLNLSNNNKSTENLDTKPTDKTMENKVSKQKKQKQSKPKKDIKDKTPLDPKKKKIIIIAVCSILVVVLGIFGAAAIGNSMRHGLSQEELTEKMNKLKDSYKAAGIELQDSDIELVDDGNGGVELRVKEEKQSEANKTTDDTMAAINTNMFGEGAAQDGSSGDNSTGDSQQSGGDSGSQETPDNPNGDNNDSTDDENQNSISKEELLAKINKQVSAAKAYMDRSLNEETNEIYAPALKTLIENIKNGNDMGDYDSHPGYPNGLAFEILCTIVNSEMESGGTESVWDNSALFEMMDYQSTVHWNSIVNQYYNHEFKDITLVGQNDTKEYEYYGGTIKSSYVAVIDGYNVYLDYSLNVLDIEKI